MDNLLDSFPIFLNLRRARPLVIGSGHLAVAKVRTLLLRAGQVDIMCRALPLELKKFAASGRVHRLRPLPVPQGKGGAAAWRKLLAGRPLVVIDPMEKAVVDFLPPLCVKLGLPVNVADNSEKSSFSFGAMVDRRPLTIAIATDGIIPVLATNIRQQVEQAIPDGVGEVMAVARHYRARVNRHLPMGLKRRLFWQEFLNGQLAAVVRRGLAMGHMNDVDKAVAELLAQLTAGVHPLFQRHNQFFLLAVEDTMTADDLSLAMVRVIKNADHIILPTDGADGAAALSAVSALARREVQITKMTLAPSATAEAVDAYQTIRDQVAGGQSVVMVVRAGDYEKTKLACAAAGLAVQGFRPLYGGEQAGEVETAPVANPVPPLGSSKIY